LAPPGATFFGHFPEEGVFEVWAWTTFFFPGAIRLKAPTRSSIFSGDPGTFTGGFSVCCLVCFSGWFVPPNSFVFFFFLEKPGFLAGATRLRLFRNIFIALHVNQEGKKTKSPTNPKNPQVSHPRVPPDPCVFFAAFSDDCLGRACLDPFPLPSRSLGGFFRSLGLPDTSPPRAPELSFVAILIFTAIRATRFPLPHRPGIYF